MTLEKAIELSSLYLQDRDCPFSSDARDAVKLNIEAAKRLQELRKFENHNPKWALPGETQEYGR